MKMLILILVVGFSQPLFSQTGSLQLECLQQNDRKAVTQLMVEIHSDSACFEGFTGEDGKFIFRGIPTGELELWFLQNNQLRTSKVFIQENQLLQNTFLFDSLFAMKEPDFGNQFVNNSNGTNKDARLMLDGNRIRTTQINLVASVQEISCVMVTAYTTPLINRDGSASGATITREDISRLPVRTANEIASTVGGVNTQEVNNGIHIRGGRAEANAYYVDGVRVNSNFSNLPKSSLGEVSVLTGGIPANYGDATGGIIAVQTKPTIRYGYNSYPSKTKKNKQPEIISRPYVEPEPYVNYDQFLPIYENDFLSSISHPNSTFGIDVDRASWTYVKRMMSVNQFVQKDAVKLEEMINAFHYMDVPQNDLINLAIRRVECPWNAEHELVSIHLKAKDLPKDLPRKKHNLVFLIDVSGSMASSDKLHLLIQGFKQFVNVLNEDDYVSIVTYAGASGVALEPTSCNQKEKIIASLDRLTSGGSTNGIGGITQAYELAEKNFNPEKNNRIILATDGDFNVGINAPGDLEQFIASKRGKGIYLTALGFGMGNYHNSTLETMADKGDGNHFYINNLAECKKVLIDDLGNILNIARDVKLNVEFNPDEVKEYRLIGYENRMLKPRDFEDDTKDAGEIGYGHEVTAVYEIVLGKAESDKNHFTKSKETMGNNSELAFVKLRYKPFEDSASIEKRFSLSKTHILEKDPLLTAVIGFGLQLRNSAFKGMIDNELLTKLANSLEAKTEDEKELQRLMVNYSSKK